MAKVETITKAEANALYRLISAMPTDADELLGDDQVNGYDLLAKLRRMSR